MDSLDSDDGAGGGGRAKRGRRAAADSDDSDGEPRAGLGGAVLGGGGRRKRRQSDDNVFGIFATGDDSPPRQAKDRGQKSDFTKPLAFVRGDTINKTHVPTPKPPGGETEGSDDEIDPRFRFDGAPNAKGLPPREHGPNLPARNKLSFGQMAQSYGKGFSMLQKMGFQGGGLGRNEDGIANPIEVIKRKEKQGLQDEGEMAEQDLYGRDAVGSRRTVEELLAARSKKKDETVQAGEGWKVDSKSKRPRTVYKSAAGVAAGGTRIIDMRGPETRVVASFSELAASISGDSVKNLKELRHNVRLLVAKYEDKVRAMSEKKRYYEDVLLSVAREKERLEAAGSIKQEDAQHCSKMVREIEGLRKRHDNGSVNIRDLGLAFGKMCREQPKEFKAMRVFDVAVAMAVPAATCELASWDPLVEPEDGLALLTPWQKLAEDAGEKHGFIALCDSALLPRLRNALCEWLARDFEPCIWLFECCRRTLPADAVDAIARQVLLPRLQSEVDAWDPRVDKVSIHLWVHPWLSVLGNALDCLWAPIRFKLSASLDRWSPSDSSALEMIRPWKVVFDPVHWEPLIEKVLARHAKVIVEMQVCPDGQDTGPIKHLLSWLDVAPAAGICHVLDAAFFPLWQRALRDWLRAPQCDYGQVVQWYQLWRTMFPEVIREQALVQRQLAHGLTVMKHRMAKGSNNDADESPLEPPSRPDVAAAAQRPAVGASAKALVAEEVSLSLSDYLAEVAAEQGLVFRPKKVQHLGKQVYQLGASSIYLERNLVYAAPKAGQEDEWRLVSLDEVLSLAKASAPAQR